MLGNKSILKVIKCLPSSSSSNICDALSKICFCRSDLVENKEELVRKVERFSPISLNSLSCSRWAPIAMDTGNVEDVD